MTKCLRCNLEVIFVVLFFVATPKHSSYAADPVGTVYPSSSSTSTVPNNNSTNPFDWDAVDPTVYTIDIEKKYYTGPFYADRLPRGLLKFRGVWNEFTGTIAWTLLPKDLKFFDVGYSKFTGTVPWNELPATLE
eukprot:PhF_6_TR14646/c0_g1_i1/m.23120